METEKKKCRVMDKEQCSTSAPDDDDTVAIARDRSKMSLRLFELCSCKPELEYLPLLVTEKIFGMVGIKELKALRLVSRTLRQRIEEVTTVFKRWEPKGGYQLTQDLVRLSSEVETMEELKFSLDFKSWKSNNMEYDEAIKKLKEDHPELKVVNLHIAHVAIPMFEVALKVLKECGSLIKRLDISPDSVFNEENREKWNENIFFNADLTNLEVLNFGSGVPEEKQLMDKILGACGDKLIAFDAFSDGWPTYLPDHSLLLAKFKNIQELKINHPAIEFRDEDVAVILSVCGRTLLTLEIGESLVTGNFTYTSENPLQLRVLNLEECWNLNDRGLSYILRLFGRTLTSLNFSSTQLTGKNLSFSGKLPQLSKLAISRSALNSTGLKKFLTYCTAKLTEIDMNEKDVVMPFFKPGSPISNLMILDLGGCSGLTDRKLQRILKIHINTLKELDLTDTPVSGEALSGIAANSGCLVKLGLGCNSHITDEGLSKLMSIFGHSLEDLAIHNTAIVGTSFGSFYLPRLKKLYLAGCEFLTDNGLQNILTRIGPKLQKLTLRDLNISELLVPRSLELPEVTYILMNSLKNFTGQGLDQLFDKCGTKLKELEISESQNLGKHFSSEVMWNVPHSLEVLSLRETKLTDIGLLRILKNAQTSLLRINISQTSVTGADFSSSGINLGNLRRFDHEDCKYMTREGLKEILSLMPQIKTFYDENDLYIYY